MLTIRKGRSTLLEGRTWFNCPHCMQRDAYIGVSAPFECVHCRAALPDINGLQKQISLRRVYYQGKFLETWRD